MHVTAVDMMNNYEKNSALVSTIYGMASVSTPLVLFNTLLTTYANFSFRMKLERKSDWLVWFAGEEREDENEMCSGAECSR